MNGWRGKLPTDRHSKRLGHGRSRSTRSLFDCCGQLLVEELSCFRPIWIGRASTKGSFRRLMLVVRERFEFCHCVNV